MFFGKSDFKLLSDEFHSYCTVHICGSIQSELTDPNNYCRKENDCLADKGNSENLAEVIANDQTSEAPSVGRRRRDQTAVLELTTTVYNLYEKILFYLFFCHFSRNNDMSVNKKVIYIIIFLILDRF